MVRRIMRRGDATKRVVVPPEGRKRLRFRLSTGTAEENDVLDSVDSFPLPKNDSSSCGARSPSLRKAEVQKFKKLPVSKDLQKILN